MSVETFPSLERVYYECWLYGDDVYYGFAQYCFWRTIVEDYVQWWIDDVPEYFRCGEAVLPPFKGKKE